MEPEREPRHDAEVAATTTDRPEQVRLVLGVDVVDLTIGRHDLRRDDVVDGQAVLAHEVADATAGDDAADADRTGIAEADDEAVLAGRGVDLGRREAGLGGRRLRRGVDVDRLEPAQVEDDAALGRAVAGAAVAAAPDGKLEPGVGREADDLLDVADVGGADDGGRMEVAVHHLPLPVVAGVGRAEHLARDGSADGIEVEGRGSGRNGHDRLLGHGEREAAGCRGSTPG